MIKLLLTDTPSQKVVESLNEIPEFEVVVKMSPNLNQLEREIKNYDAVVVSGATVLNRDILEGARHLKIIVNTGIKTDNIDDDFARSKNIEVRNVHHERIFPAPHPGGPAVEARERAGFEAISILKEFFNA